MYDHHSCRSLFSTTQRILPTLIVGLIVGWIIPPIVTSSAEEKGAAIIGRIVFKGSVPPVNEVIVREDEEFCGQTVSIQTIDSQPGTGGLRQAVVSLTGITQGAAATPGVSHLRNEQCAFLQRVSATRLGDSLEVKNLDPILHNAHGMFGKRTILNVAQVPNGRPFRKRMKYSGQLTIKCDKHDFMQAHVMVFPHPYFSVTDETGQYRIDSVPPGHHRITVWHETLGQMEKDIDIPAHGTITMDLEFP